METSTVTPRKVPTTGRGVVLDVADVSDAPDPDGDDICAADSVECVYVYGAPVCVTVCCWVCDSGNEARQDVVVAPSPGGLVMTAGEDVIPVNIVRPLAGASPIVGTQSTHGWQRQPQVHTEPALPLSSSEGHDPIMVGETGQPSHRRPVQCTGLRSVTSHAGAQDGMTWVALLGIWSDLNLLLLMEAP